MRCIGSVFNFNISCIVNDDFRSFLISNNSLVDDDVHVNVDNYLNFKFYDHNFQSKRESNSNNFKPEILFPVFSLIFYHIFLKYNLELRIKIFECITLVSVLNVLHFFTRESINTCDSVETLCLHFNLVLFLISKL